jgi:mannose-1-phosphate guanylyltransferase
VLRFLGERSLIQQTVDRLSPVIPPERIWGSHQRSSARRDRRQLPEVPKNQILAEPAQRNTAPAIGLAAHILQSIDPNAVMGVFPSDHVIAKPARYLQFVRPRFKAAAAARSSCSAFSALARDRLRIHRVSQNARPDRASRVPVRRFREKPDLKTARRYVRGRQLLLERGHVLLENFGAAGRPARVLAQNRDAAGQPAGIRQPALPAS